MISRRTLLKRGGQIGAGGFVASTLAATTSARPSTFVRTEGDSFTIDGVPTYFAGSNNFWLTNSGTGQGRVDDILDQFESMGLDVIRMWANGAGSNRLQTSPGEYDESLLRLHDYVLSEAGERDMRVIPSLVDNWTHEGGMLKYAEWADGDSRGFFYQDSQAREYYRDHVKKIVTRENYHTGTEWRDDPTIMMWELANEPRLEADDDGLDGDSSEIRSEGRHREVLGAWIQDMSEYIKELDSEHLVSTGSEGHFYREGESYPNGTWGGQDFLAHHDYDSIDAASFHWYPDHWFGHDGGEIPYDRGSQWITDHVESAHDELEKPAYLGEFNVRVDTPENDASEGVDLETRQKHLQEWYDTADEVDCDGTLIWQIVLDSTEDHDGFQIYPSQSGSIVEEYAETAEEKSSETTTTTTDEDPTTPDDGWVSDATDPNDDGLYEDLNGDGTVNFPDVNTLFQNTDSEAVQSNTEMFDYTDDGEVDLQDVLALFEMV